MAATGSGQFRLALLYRPIAQVLPFKLDQVECVEVRSLITPAAVQEVEVRDAVRAAADRLAIDSG